MRLTQSDRAHRLRAPAALETTRNAWLVASGCRDEDFSGKWIRGFLYAPPAVDCGAEKDWTMFLSASRAGQLARTFLMITPNAVLTFSRSVVALVLCVLAAGCINPLGPVGKGPQPPPPRSAPHLSDKFAWGISTSSYQYRRSRRKARRQRILLLRLGYSHRATQGTSQRQCALQLDSLREGSCGSKKDRGHPLSLQHFVATRRTKTRRLQ